MFKFLREEMDMDFTGGEDPKSRQERSNTGADALAQSVLLNVLGLTQETTQRVVQMIASAGENTMMNQHIKTLPMSAHSRLNQILDMVETGDMAGDDDLDPEETDAMVDQSMDYEQDMETDPEAGSESYPDGYDGVIDNPEDPDNIQFKDAFDKGPVWDPDQDREDEYSQQANSANAYQSMDSDDYMPKTRKESYRPSFRSYLVNENADADATIAGMGDAIDDDIDPADQTRIQQLQKAGNTAGAEQFRARSIKKKNSRTPKKPMTSQERNVDKAKQNLARAVDQQSRAER